MKPLFVISCPIDTYSGYGARSRDLVKALIELDKYDVKIIPQKWGNCPWGFIEDNPEWGFMQEHILAAGSQLSQQPPIWAQITVPNEFQPLGKFNIGITAGIETTHCDPSWIEGMNKMDLNLVPSQHSKHVFESCKFEKRDSNTNTLVEIVEIKRPIEVLFEGVNLDVYKSIPSGEVSLDLTEVTENFAYLFVGHWMNGEIGEDRKNVGLLVKSFYELFKNKRNTPALILKTSGAGASYLDREAILNKIHQIKDSVEANNLPNVYLLHGEFSDKEINELYNHKKVKAMVSLTKGEGFGRPLLEFTQAKKPIIATNWSGHVDFLNSKFTTLLKGELTSVHPSALVPNIILENSQWFSVHHGEIGKSLNDVFVNYNKYKENAKKQASFAKNRFSYESMRTTLDSILEVIPEFPQLIELKLPELESLDLPELETL